MWRRLIVLVIGLLVAGCVPPPGSGPILRGRLVMPKASMRTAMLPSDIIAEATVSLIAPDDHTTVAVGLTDQNGAFTLNTPAPANGMYSLIAAKRVDGEGRLLQLSTLVSFDGSNWISITRSSPDVVINSTTTAVTIVADALGVMPVEWLRKVDIDPDSGEYLVVDPTLVTGSGTSLVATVYEVADHIEALVDLDIDPLRGVCFVGSATSDGNNPVAAGTSGVTRVRVDGFGFDPVPERNSVGFQVGRQFYWAQALSGSTEKTLFARIPAIPPSDISSGAMAVPVHVRNGVGALEVNIDQPPVMALQFPRAVPDTAAQLPADPGSPRLGSFAVGPLSGIVNVVWPDARYAGLSPILRIWNLQSNVLATTPPQVAITTSPNVAGDPGFFPQVFVKETAATETVPMQIQSHVIWQGRHTQSGNNAIFHRMALNGVWQTWSGPGPAAVVGLVGGGPGQDCISPSIVQDDTRVVAAYGDSYAAGKYNVKVRLWNGTLHFNIPDWVAAPTYLLTSNGSTSTTAKLPQVAVSKNGPSGAPYYHVLWYNTNGGGDLQYRRGLPNPTATIVSWDPNPVPAAPPATWHTNVGAVDDLALAADTAGNLLSVWLNAGALVSKSVPAGLATAGISTIGTLTPPPLPRNAKETSPRLVAVATDDFYLISASTTADDPEAAGEIWLRRWHGGVWTGPVRLSHSPGVPSAFPSLHWNGASLTAAWQEGATMVYELVIMPI